MLYDGSSKLGAAALALLAIVESPARAEYAKQEAGLKRTLEHLWMPNGSFRTFLIPADRNDNQNFYPGEALLAWARLLMKTTIRPSRKSSTKASIITGNGI